MQFNKYVVLILVSIIYSCNSDKGDQLIVSTNEEKRVAKNSFGHSVTMIFRNDLLIGQILFNNIP